MLGVKLAGVSLKNPSILAAGILGTNASILKRVASSGAGAVTMKSIGPAPREGNPNPTVLCSGDAMLNAVGLPSPGYQNMGREWEELKEIDVPIIASFYAGSIKEFVEVAEAIVPHKPAMLDINIGCPNTKSHGMIFGKDPETAGELVGAVKDVAGKIPIMPKLTPNADKMLEVAKACEDAGADAIAGFNTWGPGMVIDIGARRPVLAFKTGGVSGPAIKTLTIAGIYKLYETVKVPIVAVGGITYGKDALEAIMAGATAIEMGSAVHYRGVDVFRKANTEMEQWMKENGVKSLKELVGSAH